MADEDFDALAEPTEPEPAPLPTPPDEDFDALADAPTGPLTELRDATFRVAEATRTGFNQMLDLIGFGFSKDVAEFLQLRPEPGDPAAIRAIKRTSALFFETPVQAFDLAIAGVEGVLFGLGQIAREFGASDTDVKRTIRETNTFLLSRAGITPSAVPRAPMREAFQRAVPRKARREAGIALDTELDRFASAVGGEPTPPVRVINSTFDRIITRVFDGLRPILRAGEKVGEREFQRLPGHTPRPYLEMRLLTGVPSVVNATFNRGPILRVQPGQKVRVEGVPVPLQPGSVYFAGPKGLNQIIEQMGDNTRLGMLYFAARSAKGIRDTRPEVQLPAGMTDASIARVIKLGNKDPNIVRAFNEYQEFNRTQLNLPVQSGVLSAEGRNAFIAARGGAFTPFYRVVQETLGGNVRAGRSVLKRLRGGPQNLRDIAENVYGNQQMWVELSMRNFALREVFDMIDRFGMDEIATRVKSPLQLGRVTKKGMEDLTRALPEDMKTAILSRDELVQAIMKTRPLGREIVTVYRKGKAQHYEIHDPLFLDAMTAFDPRMLPWGLRFAGGAKTLFTRLVTMAPPFMVMNQMRDMQTAFMQSDGLLLPGITALRGMKSRMLTDENYWLAMANGVGFSTLFKGESAGRGSRARLFYATKGIDKGRVLDSAKTLMHHLEETTSALELSSRLEEFRRVSKTGDLREGGFSGREVTVDFGKRGSSETLRVLTQLGPFLNAGLLGMEKTGQTAVRHPTRTVIRGVVALTIPTLALYQINKDDPDYQALPDYLKDLTWPIKIPGQGFALLPRGFEYGAVFSAVPERIMEAVQQRHGKRFADSFLNIVLNQLRLDPTPQIVSPILDDLMNQKFPGSPIVSERFKRVRPTEQFQPWTSETMVELARILREDTGVEMSPVRAEALVRGYLGTIGIYLLDASDMLARVGMKGELPTPRIEDRPLIRRFWRGFPLRNSQFTADFYEFLSEARIVTGTFSKMIREAREPDLDKPEMRLMAIARAANRVSAVTAQMNAEIRRVYADEKMSGGEKARRMDIARAARNKLHTDFMTKAVPEDILRELGLPVRIQKTPPKPSLGETLPRFRIPSPAGS